MTQIRIVMYSLRFPKIFWIDSSQKWFNYRKRAYRNDNEAVCQVIEKNGRITAKVEALYIEGYPLPIRSKLDVKKVTLEHVKELRSELLNQPSKGLFDFLRRN